MTERLDLAQADWRGSREFFDEIKASLDQLLQPEPADRYDFSWLGKRQSLLAAALPTNQRLICDPASSNDFNQTGNLAIIGDNLDALKLLQESYYRQVKMIYIDPPYNTGHDLIMSKTFELHAHDQSIKIETTESLDPNTKARPDFHSNWLSMMYPRLLLAQNLLTDDGAIFISIDQNEFANLKKLCDEIFGEENFITLAMRQKNRVVMKSNKAFKNYLEPVLIYARDKSHLDLTYTKPTNATNDFSLICAGYGLKELTFRPGQLYFTSSVETISAGQYENCELLNSSPIVNHVNQAPLTIRAEFKWSQAALQAKLRRGATIQIKNPATMVMRLHTTNATTTPQDYINEQYGLVTNDDGMNELAALQLGQYFSYPKPTQLIQFFANLMHDPSAIIMDFFAGSGTTGQAVLQQNMLDGGHRQYILIQIPEPVNTPQVKRPRIKTLDQLMLERLRRAGRALQPQAQKGQLDVGFRVFRLRDKDAADHSDLEQVFLTLSLLGLPLHLPLQTCSVGQSQYYLYDYRHPQSGLAFCFQLPDSELLTQLLAKQPSVLIVPETIFADSTAQADFEQTCQKLSPTTQLKVLA